MLLGVPKVLLATVSVAVSGIGCLAAPIASRGHALYPEAGARLPISQVASLVLPPTAVIKTLDGRQVSGVGVGGVFELLPGCHIIEIAYRSVYTGRYAPWVGFLDPSTFVFDMKPGHEYAIVAYSISTMTTVVYATEQDPFGARTRTIDRVHPAVAPQACQDSGDVRTVDDQKNGAAFLGGSAGGVRAS